MSLKSCGGKARAARLSPERRREIARAAAQARWSGSTRHLPLRSCIRGIEAAMARMGYIHGLADAWDRVRSFLLENDSSGK